MRRQFIAGPLDDRLATLLALVATALILWPLNGLERDYDEGVYWQSLRAMASGHPLFTSVFSSQPPFFLLSVYPFYMLFGQSIAAARFGVYFSRPGNGICHQVHLERFAKPGKTLLG